MAEHNQTGKEGEKAALMLLNQKGYRIRHTNWVTGKLELDIVAEHNNTLVVIEVKTRNNLDYGNPWDAISNAKIRNIVMATDNYIRIYNINMDVRFDVISVLKTPDGYIPEHIEDAFYPPIW